MLCNPVLAFRHALCADLGSQLTYCETYGELDLWVLVQFLMLFGGCIESCPMLLKF